MSILKKSLYLQKTTKTEAIENGKPVIATVNGSEEGVNHEVVVVGFPDEGDEETKGDDDGYNEFIDVVPSDEENEDENEDKDNEDEDKDNDETEEDGTESEGDDENDDERPIIVYDPATGMTYSIEFDKALDVGCPILSVIDGNATDSFKYEPIEHMIVIIGETESGGMYICIDPSDGDYKTVSSFSLLGDSYKINYLKRY